MESLKSSSHENDDITLYFYFKNSTQFLNTEDILSPAFGLQLKQILCRKTVFKANLLMCEKLYGLCNGYENSGCKYFIEHV